MFNFHLDCAQCIGDRGRGANDQVAGQADDQTPSEAQQEQAVGLAHAALRMRAL